MDHKCDECGSGGASLVEAGYCRPLPDVAPTFSQWEELWLCENCRQPDQEINHEDKVASLGR